MSSRVPSLLLGALLAATSPASAVEPLTVPRGAAPLIDHRLDDAAWQTAAKRALPDGTEIWVQQDDAYLYVAFKAPAPRVFGMDFVIAEKPDRLVNLHASSYLGERVAADGKWPDWTWWEHRDWTATIVPYEMKDGRPQFVATAGKEFQLRKTRFDAERYRVRLELRYGRGVDAVVYPADAAPFDPAAWLELVLR
jgi:hypothetical protein